MQVLDLKNKSLSEKDILKKYPESLYLPVWIIKDSKNHRKLSYNVDIKPKINWNKLEYKKWLKNDILPALSKNKDTYEILIDLEEHKRVDLNNGVNAIMEIPYVARRASDIIGNAFIAHQLAKMFISECRKNKDNETLKTNSGFITQEFIKKLSKEKYLRFCLAWGC